MKKGRQDRIAETLTFNPFNAFTSFPYFFYFDQIHIPTLQSTTSV